MKKLTVLLLLGLFLLAACGGGADTTTESANEAGTTAVTQPQPPTPEPATATPLPPPPISVMGEDGETAVINQPPASQFLAPWPADKFGYGIQSHAVVGDPAGTMDAIKNQLGMSWVKVQVEWEAVQPSPEETYWFYDAAVEQAHEKGLYLMLSVVAAPSWTRSVEGMQGPPDDFNLYYNFLRELLTRYQGKVHAIEVWNEENLDREWLTSTGLSAESYTQLLQGAYETIKSVDPNVIVISGALAPTGGWTEPDGRVTALDDFVYLDQMIAAGFLNYADCVGVHHNGYNIGPDVAFDQTGNDATAVFRGPFDNIHHSWSFKTTVDTYAQKIQAVDPAKKLCVTEFGWASSEGYDETPEGFAFALDNTLEEQASFIVQAFQQMRDSGDVWIAYLFNFDFGNKSGGPTDDPVPYSLVDTNGVPRPAFGAVAGMEKE